MDLMFPIIAGVIIAVAGGLLLDRIRGVASRAEGRMTRALRDLPNETDRERWMEEFRQLLSEYEGRPFKQYRESREQIRAAKGLVRVYAQPAPKPADHVQGDPTAGEVEHGHFIWKAEMVEALKHVSYRERRIFELLRGFDGKGPRTLNEVGRAFNLATEDVLQIEIQCRKKVYAFVDAQKLREGD